MSVRHAIVTPVEAAQALIESCQEQLLREMKDFDPLGSYFALTLGVSRGGQLFCSTQTHWVGWSERNPRWEIRAASLVNPRLITEMWDKIGRGWVSVHDDASLSVYARLGGNALVEESVAETHLRWVIAPSECVHDGDTLVGGGGFTDTSRLPDSAAQRRAPDRKLRMRVLKRDGYRCVACGRRPGDHVDLELHVHHVIPWRMHGPTAEDNLVTLCGTCHKGLDPDFEPSLRELAKIPGRTRIHDRDGTEFRADVSRYREWAASAEAGAAPCGAGHP
jgi:hypothetical protein